jgi:DNA-binding NarL/FixJ family response regulator
MRIGLFAGTFAMLKKEFTTLTICEMKIQNKISVFLVDDNDMFLQTLTLSLNEQFKSEIEVETFTTGENCLNKIQENPESTADIVILDYHLNTDSKNAMNGVDILKKIKKLNSKIVVVMLSAEDKINIASECITNGAYEYVVKSETALIRTQNILKNSMEREFNSRILKTTMTILEKYPELSKYIEEMQETIPNEASPAVTLRNLKAYLDSLNSMLDKYKVEHPSLSPLSV